MARITVEDCLQQIGNENRFALIHLAVERVKQHRQGAPFPERCKNKELVCTLREIAAGTVNFDNVYELRKSLLEQTGGSTDSEPAATEAQDNGGDIAER